MDWYFQQFNTVSYLTWGMTKWDFEWHFECKVLRTAILFKQTTEKKYIHHFWQVFMVWVIQCIHVHIHLASEYCRYGLFQEKKQTGWVKDILFWKRPGIFHFYTFSLEIPDKAKLHPWKFHEIVLELSFLGNLKTKNQDPWKFCINFSSSTLEIPLRFY